MDEPTFREIQVPDCLSKAETMPRPASPTYEVTVRSTEVWFEDGSIILQAENTQFKVYRGILAVNSPVFQDMFSLSLPDGSDLVDNCPVVRLQDSALDTMHFLNALHCVSYYDDNVTSYLFIAAILRLATKYSVEHLRSRAFQQLATLYPTSIDEWDQRVDTIVDVFEARPFAVLQLAKETGHHSLLPAAMYLCSDSVNINDILDGVQSLDNSHIDLEWSEKRACLRARQNLLLALRSRIFKFLVGNVDVPGGCTSPVSCDSSKFKWLRSLEATLNSGSPGVFSIKFPWVAYQRAVCNGCFVASEAHSNAQRKALWDELPSFFDLPSWSELKKHGHGP